MEHEEWRKLDLPESEREYWVSSLGRIRRSAITSSYILGNSGRMWHRYYPEAILKPITNSKGYHVVTLQFAQGDRDKRQFQIAPLVCRAFNGPPPRPGLHCAHLDGNKTNNTPANLAWVTGRENEAHKLLHGTRMMGERHNMAKLTESDIRAIRATPKVRGSGLELAARFCVTPTTISDIRNGRIWRHVA